MLTEHEAKTKWCPFVRQAAILQEPVSGVAAVNRATAPDGEMHQAEHTSCIASGCMAWREDATARGRGYCGIAGPIPYA